MKYSIQEMDVLSIVTILGSIMIKQRLDQLMIYRKLMVWLILLLTFFSIELAAIEKKSMSFLPPQLRIAIASDLMPYCFVDDKGQAKGLLVDYWRLWSKKTNHPIVFIPSTWLGSLDLLKTKQADIHAGLFKLASRDKDLDYLAEIYPTKSNFYVHRSEGIMAKNLSSLDGKIVGVIADSFYDSYIQEHYPNLIIKRFVKFSGLVDAINNDQIDLFLSEAVTSWFSLIGSLRFNDYRVIDSKGMKNNFYGAAPKGNIKLQQYIRLGMAQITTQDVIELENKWIDNPRLHTLMHFDVANNKLILTDQERHFITHHPILKIGVEAWQPIIYSDDGVKVKGIVGDFLELISQSTGFKMIAVKDDWANLLRDFKQGKIDLLPTAYYSDSRAKFGLYGDGYARLGSSIFTLESNNSINSLQDLVGKRLAVVAADARIGFIETAFPTINIVTTNNPDDSLSLLVNGEVDAIFELDIVMNFVIHNRMIVGVKSIQQTRLRPRAMHFLSGKQQPLLHSILNKALISIGNTRKNKIIDKWIGSVKVKQAVNIAFGIGREPYTLNKQYLKGIEYDLITRIFELSGIAIGNVKNLPLSQLAHALAYDEQLDVTVTVKAQQDQFFYSDDFITFRNVAISRQADRLNITSITDLANKKILAFAGASGYLGADYNRLFPSDYFPLQYQEVAEQIAQIDALLTGAVDVIVLDINIFKWFIRKAGFKDVKDFSIHEIFPKSNNFRVAFRDKSVRDLFNFNLKKLRQSGEFDHIIDEYAVGNVVETVEFTSFISALVAKPIFNNNKDELEPLVDLLASLPYVNKIEVYNNDDRLLYSSSSLVYQFPKQQDSYDLLSGITLKVGAVKVYLNQQELTNQLALTGLIPPFSFFSHSKQSRDIKNIYQRFDYLEQKLTLTNSELNYLSTNPILKFSDVNWRPLSIVNNGRYTGLIADYMALITKVTGIEFEYVPHDSWKSVIDSFNNKLLDAVFSAENIAKGLKQGIVSDEFVNFRFAIVMPNSESFVGNINELSGKTIAAPQHFSSLRLLKESYPELKIIETNSVLEALTLVNDHNADVYIGHLAVVVHQLESYFPDLKIVGLLDNSYSHRVTLHQKDQTALAIINKAINLITPEQHLEIKQRWVKGNITTAVDYRLVYQIIGVFMIILMIILVVIKKLSYAKDQVDQANNKMRKTLIELEEQKDVFETLFYETSDGLLLMSDHMFIDCNSSALKMLGFDSKTELLNSSIFGISPLLQPDGQSSKEKYLIIEELCHRQGHHRFEWVHRNKQGVDVWLEIVMTFIKLNQQELNHVVWRDIGDKKLLEQQILARNNELESINLELNNSILDLQQTQKKLVESEKMASLGGLVAGVAHEINTPVGIGLTAITHFVEITRQLEQKHRQKKMSQKDFDNYLVSSIEAASIINRNLERTAELVRSFKQISVDQSSDERRVFNVSEYINEILLSINHIMKKSNVEIAVRCDEELEIDSYPGAISQIISNLLINSTIHAYPNNETGLINITVHRQGDAVLLQYKDDGIGVPKDNLSKIFDPFFTTNREHGGSGLGLNIIYNIVTNRLNGKIECHSKSGFGTEFTIEFKPIVIV